MEHLVYEYPFCKAGFTIKTILRKCLPAIIVPIQAKAKIIMRIAGHFS